MTVYAATEKLRTAGEGSGWVSTLLREIGIYVETVEAFRREGCPPVHLAEKDEHGARIALGLSLGGDHA